MGDSIFPELKKGSVEFVRAYYNLIRSVDRMIKSIRAIRTTKGNSNAYKEDYKLLRRIQKITTKNKAILFIRHENEYIQYHCERIIKEREIK